MSAWQVSRHLFLAVILEKHILFDLLHRLGAVGIEQQIKFKNKNMFMMIMVPAAKSYTNYNQSICNSEKNNCPKP